MKRARFTHEATKKRCNPKTLAGLQASLLSWEDWPAKEVGFGIFLARFSGGSFSELNWHLVTPGGVVWLEDWISELRVVYEDVCGISRFTMNKYEYTR